MSDGILEGDDLQLWRDFLRWSQGIHAAVNRAVATTAGLSVPEFEVLTRLWSAPGQRVPQLDLSDGLNWSASRASHLLHRLETRGFIRREDAARGRARIVQLTPEGLEHLTGAFDAHGSAFRRELLDRLTVEQRRNLASVMARRV